ncbi:uncharacterized protein LOC108053424 [Drosophila rhopaloa]|uniref:DUF7775 domain-containing protein n=2 Tax=Drosophila rhopaloa TaxID=1041015 RepID=A0ABM5I7R6_DRORH|nr:uncharacterized protein LOC108053424 [Drosophila rhopaloa]
MSQSIKRSKNDTLTKIDSVVGRYQPEALRPVLFVFYTLETVFNMFCMGYHITGFMTIDLSIFDWQEQAIHYFYLVTFYVFMVLTLFQSVNICTGHTPTLYMEIWKASAASFAFILISLTSMWDAERQFHLFVSLPEVHDHGNTDYVEDPPVHPFFHYLQGQSISSLACGTLYLLHATIMIDVKLTANLNRGQEKGSYMPIPLFVLGRVIHSKLNRFEWFKEFCDNETIRI